MQGKTDYRFEAHFLISIGISVIPVKSDGSKLPAIKWKEFQSRLMRPDEVEKHFKDCGGVIAITGNISNLLCIDFDLDKQRPTDDFWGKFAEGIPEEMKAKMLVNQTRSGGFHIWVRTKYEDKSRKIAHRPLMIPELYARYNEMISAGANEETASRTLLKKPLECIIETRSRGSYGVFVHEQYKRFYGDEIGEFSIEEVEFLLNQAYSLDHGYKKPTPFTGKVEDYKILSRFNEDVTPTGMVELIESSGLFTLYDMDTNGNYRLARVGSSSPFSAYVYSDTGVLHVFGLNPLTEEDKQTMSPFEVYCAVNGYSTGEAINQIREHYKS